MFLVCAVLLGAIGCGSSATVTLLRPVSLPPKDPAAVKIWMGKDQPDCAFETIGRVSGSMADDRSNALFHNADGDVTDVLFSIREAVAKVGGDGVVGFQTAPWGTVGAGRAASSGDVYVCKKGDK
jgi:hypothetical protein